MLSFERLPHFRLGFTPSGGDELQSEYALPRAHGMEAVRALRELAPLVAPVLYTSEIRTVAADELWLSPFYERDSITVHFTWKPLDAEVRAVLPRVEAVLERFGARPHWGKVFTLSPARVAAVYPQLPAFRDLRARLDPQAVFRNDFVDDYLGT